MPVDVLSPTPSPSPGIVLLTAVFGAEPAMVDIAAQFVERGYLVAIPDLFWRDDAGPLARKGDERTRALARKERVDVRQTAGDVAALCRFVKRLPECNGWLAAAGYCFGGRYAFLAAANGEVNAAVAFHPTEVGASLAELKPMRVPVSLHFGSEDPLTPASEIEAIDDFLRVATDVEREVYPGARHSFAIAGADGYDAAAARLSLERALAFLDRFVAR